MVGGSGRNGYPLKDSKVVLKGMRYTDLEVCVFKLLAVCLS